MFPVVVSSAVVVDICLVGVCPSVTGVVGLVPSVGGRLLTLVALIFVRSVLQQRHKVPMRYAMCERNTCVA